MCFIETCSDIMSHHRSVFLHSVPLMFAGCWWPKPAIFGFTGGAQFQDLLQKVQVVKMSLFYLLSFVFFYIMLFCHLLSVQLSFPLYNETCANKGNGVLV